MRSRIIIFISIFLCSYYTLAQEKKAVGVKTAIVRMTDLYDIFTTIGQCKTDQSRNYYANVAGKLDFVSAQQGDKVKKGDVLLMIDKDVAMSIMSQAKISLKAAEDVYNRSQVLHKKEYTSTYILDKALADFENAKLQYTKAVNTYNDMVITAPFDGEIGVIKPIVGNDIKVKDYLFTIISQNAVTKSILVELPETLHNEVSENTDVVITDNNRNKIKAKIASISQYVSDYGTISARITIDSNNKITHGSYASIDLITNKHKSLAIPEQSVQSNSDGDFIYKINGNKVQQIYVTLGSRVNELVEIISDQIKDGDEVVYEGLTKINDGTEVSIIK